MSARLFAVIPAAGHSRRMGQPKLLLPYRGTTVIGQVLAALAHPHIAARCVVIRRDDAALQQAAENAEAWVIQPEHDPPDMRSSVESALQQISARYRPDDDDGWLLIPADSPQLSPEVLGELLTIWERERPQILTPTFQGQRGHPVLFRWSVNQHLNSIPADRGLNWLLESCAEQVLEWPCKVANILEDLDTPEDYRHLLSQVSSSD